MTENTMTNQPSTQNAATGTQDARALPYFVRWDSSRVQLRGRVVGNPDPGMYVVELFDTPSAGRTEQRVVELETMRFWWFYRTREEFDAAMRQHTWMERYFVLREELEEAHNPETGWLHPAGAQAIHEWLGDLREAAYAGDVAEAKRCADYIRWKFDLERSWYPPEPEEKATAGAS
jgi:hypothetical protein